jgi:prepilin signal peptidase PulO-like enzyme (type II secretory pathway)
MTSLANILEQNPGAVLAAADLMKALFAMAFGACIGSLTNVLVYRLPLGLDVVRPQSRCPKCGTKLTWRENIPIFGWLFLRGKCRFCRQPISPEYPLVETYVALLFGAVYLACYSEHTSPWNSFFQQFRPDWGKAGFMATWPVFIVVLTALSSLVAMFLVDAKTFRIPMVLTWVPLVVGLVAHVAFSLWVQFVHHEYRWAILAGSRIEHGWSIANPGPFGWWWTGAALGGAVGVLLSNVLLATGLITPSFADYEAWEKSQMDRTSTAAPGAEAGASAEGVEVGAPPQEGLPPVEGAEVPEAEKAAASPESVGGEARTLPEEETGRGVNLVPLGTTAVLVVAGAAAWVWQGGSVLTSVVVGIVALIHAGILLVLGQPAGESAEEAERWLEYPHARREMVRELIFLAPVIGLALVGGAVAYRWGGPWTFSEASFEMIPANTVPLWLSVLAGVLMGYLIGAGLVWMVRIGGSLAFGREAMGLGDAHLLGAVGACLGWIDAVATFFVAVVLGAVWGGMAKLQGEKAKALPFGPFLAMAALVVWFGKQGLIEWAINAIAKPPIPIHIP